MRLYSILLMAFLSFFINYIAGAQEDLRGSFWSLLLREDGAIDRLIVEKEYPDTIYFSKHQKPGPVFYTSVKRTDDYRDLIQDQVIGTWRPIGKLSYQSKIGDLLCTMAYKNINDQLALEVSIKNVGSALLQPFKAGIKLGIDTYMDKYPDWLNAYFPTLLRNEQTHFWGYLMTPKRKVVALSSPDPIASWSLDYNYWSNVGNQKGEKPYFWGAHRIEGINIDFINALPLPERCPQHLFELHPNQSYSWTLFITPLTDISQLSETVYHNTHAPFWNLPQTSFAIGEEGRIGLFSNSEPEVYMNGKRINVSEEKAGYYSFTFKAKEAGHFTLKSKCGDKVSEAIVTVRNPWDWYLDRARSEAERCPQKASSHIESWYGYTSSFIAARYIPKKDIDQRHVERFDYLYDLLHKDDVPQIIPNRVQNTTGTIDLLNLKYKAHKNIEDLKKACRLADWLIDYSQEADGSFRNNLGKAKGDPNGVIYTSVIYMAKSMLDLSLTEKELGKTDAFWKKNYKRHFASAKKAIDHLVSLHGNIQTEGEMTYEDGMIACTALQVAYMGLQEEAKKDRQKYIDEALYILEGHDCLAQLQIPDGRQRGGTMRYWESQYDVLTIPNLLNSPHGWSGWRAYATYYAYLLTGNERWLRESYNAAGSFAQLIDYKTGILRWAFCADPFVPSRRVNVPHPTASLDSLSVIGTHYHLQPMDCGASYAVIGEEYIDMISNQMYFNTQDNDVHEVFKFIGEAFLTNAFVVERNDGSLKGYNCTVKQVGDKIEICPNEKYVEKVHVNLRGKKSIRIVSAKGTKDQTVSSMTWVGL